MFVVVLSVFAAITWAAESAAQSTRPEIRAYRLAEGESIDIDGAPDEPVWQQAVPATNFLQRDPDNGEPATEQTEVRIVFDRDRLILGIICHDAEPDRLLGNQMQRDQPFSADDRFMFSIDPFNDGRTGYFFEINPSGAMGDGLITSPTGGFGGFGGVMEKSWDGIWLARVRRTGTGWTAEVEIPFKTVNFDRDTDTWGANFQRHTAGVDVTIATPQLFGETQFESDAWYVHTSKPRLVTDAGEAPAEGRSDAFGFSASLSRDPYRAEIQFNGEGSRRS